MSTPLVMRVRSSQTEVFCIFRSFSRKEGSRMLVRMDSLAKTGVASTGSLDARVYFL